MKVRIEFEDGDDCSSFNAVEFQQTVVDDETLCFVIECFLLSMNQYKPSGLIAKLLEWYFENGESEVIDKAFEAVNLKTIDAA